MITTNHNKITFKKIKKVSQIQQKINKFKNN
jgi:hypothetical protein